jgi:ferritin-like metal-binding protein YciE
MKGPIITFLSWREKEETVRAGSSALRRKTMKLNSLYDVYVHELKDLYDAEKQIIEALPKMAQAASAGDLRQAFEEHLSQSETHLERVHGILNELDVNPGNVKCDGVAGLIKEGEDVIKTGGHPAAKDASLISAAQRVEHYEIAAYGSVRTYARLLGYSKAASILQQTLDEEGETDKKLTKLAEGGILSTGINQEAKQR